MSQTAAHDPYHHLHDEAYAAPFAAGRVGWRSLIATKGRAQQSLDGEWRFALDLHDEGLRQRWYEHDDAPLSAWQVPRDYDDGAWQTITVPSCWNVARPEWTYFEGSAWYTRDVAIDGPASGERLFLRVGAASYETRLFVNGRFAGGHRGASTPFTIEITDHVRAGSNRLQLQVENRRRHDRVPMNHTDWFNYGGVFREVSLVRVPAAFISHFGVALVPGSEGRRIRFDVEIDGAERGSVSVEIAGLGGPWQVAVDGGRGSLEIEARPELWSPRRPHLYDVVASFGDDSVSERVGFREIRVAGRHIQLNGEDLFLRGICVHEDDAAAGRVTSEAGVRRLFGHVRDLGANFIRLAHYPHHERVAELADEAGLLLWSEVPVYWAIDFTNPDTLADADNQLRELIRRDRNRASVIIWGVGNENADTDERFAFMSALVRAAREMDETRLVSAACLINRVHFRIEDRLADVLDVIGLNEYFGWYEPGLDSLQRLLDNSAPDKPVVITETGADALAGRRSDRGQLFSEDHQATVLDGQLQLTASAPYIRGFCPWILYDFRSERRQTEPQRGYNRKGLIAADKTTRKLAFEVVARHYRELANAQPPRPALGTRPD